jgi:hypothetical protein
VERLLKTAMKKEENTNAAYLTSIRKQFRYYKHLGDKTLEKIPEDALFYLPGVSSNSIAMIVQHLSGNMRSRFTDFFHTDGEKPWRNRDEEFEMVLRSRQEVLNAWYEGWNCLFNIIDRLQEEDLMRIVYIRNEGHTVLEAINRQLAHYPYHIGQMIYIAKMAQGENWETLSIARGKSTLYNAEKFAEEKQRKHFTDDML